MRSYVLLLALLQALGCLGSPLSSSELESMADRGLEAALKEANVMYAGSNLYSVLQGTVKRVVPLGQNTADMMMSFKIKETICATGSGSDPKTCAFRTGFFVTSLSCSSRVRISAISTKVLSIRCGPDGSSSSESSEEIFSRRRNQFNIPFANRVPAASAPSPPPQPAQTDRSLQRQPAEERPRGDAFNNFLV